ncbi:MAG TPA: AAA family ATPase [Anaerolineales bacterium]|nr:AAA family ATPase [Anaerolineales bacterium]
MSAELIEHAFETGQDQSRLPRLVEFVGPAGAGKSTVSEALAAASERIHLCNFPDVRKITSAPFFAWNSLRTIPGLLRLPADNDRSITRREFAWLSILNGWPELLRQQMQADPRTIILDQGPVYLLTELSAFGPYSLRNRPPERPLQSLYRRWAATLEAVVWLDAPNDVLDRRIRGRGKEHIVKDTSAGTAFAFLDQFRAAYARTLSSLIDENPKIRILLAGAERLTPDEIAADLLLQFGLQP